MKTKEEEPEISRPRSMAFPRRFSESQYLIMHLLFVIDVNNIQLVFQ
jgi:hypothetical protein